MTKDQLYQLRLLLTSFGQILGALTDNVDTPGYHSYEKIMQFHKQALNEFDEFDRLTNNAP